MQSGSMHLRPLPVVGGQRSSWFLGLRNPPRASFAHYIQSHAFVHLPREFAADSSGCGGENGVLPWRLKDLMCHIWRLFFGKNDFDRDIQE